MSKSSPTSESAPPLGNRVCDRCIRKKVKCTCYQSCDQTRPACSRCRESDCECTYSLARRRPGPMKGTRQRSRVNKNTLPPPAPPRSRDPHRHSGGSNGSMYGHSEDGNSHGSVSYQTSQSPALHQPATFQNGIPRRGSTILPSEVRLVCANLRIVLLAFFDLIHSSIVLFDRSEFFSEFDQGIMDHRLYETVAAITLIILRPRSQFPISNAVEYLEHYTQTTEGFTIQDGTLGASQRACLLAYYAFHTCPDRKAWIRVGNLAREAFSLGLHQLDNPEPCLTFEKRNQLERVEAWRRVWWVIYCLDSYSNLSAATPLVIEQQSISTAIRSLPPQRARNGPGNTSELLFLANDISQIWETVQTLSRHDPTNHTQFHIILTALINEAGTLARLQIQNPNKDLQVRMEALTDIMASVRFALPPYYLTPTRVAMDQTTIQHHERLVNVLMVYTSQLLLWAAFVMEKSTKNPAAVWQGIIETCDNFVEVIKNWDPQSFTAIDPAMCLMTTEALVLQELYGKCHYDAAPDQQSKLARHKRILLLFLEQFAAHWYLPKFLIVSYEHFCRFSGDRLSYAEAGRLAKIYSGLLHHKWQKHASAYPQQVMYDPSQDAGLLDSSWLDQIDFSEWAELFDLSTFSDLPLASVLQT